MDRRRFLHATGALAACLAPSARADGGPDSWMREFEQSPAAWTLGFKSASHDLSGVAAVRGRFPEATHGVLLRNGPAIHDMSGRRYHHLFDGDGMLQRFTITRDGVAHVGKILQTAKLQAESAAQRRLVEGFGTKWEGASPVMGPDGFNVANTSVLPLAGELLALWEGGSAYSVEPDTLRAIGPKAWSPELRGVPFSAHPRIDIDGTVWNFGVSPVSDRLVIYQIGADGKLQRSRVIDTPFTAYMHDFAITERHLVFLFPPLILDRERRHQGASYLDSHEWKPEAGMKALVIDKATLENRTWLDLPAGFTLHIANAWEDGKGVVRVDYVHAKEPTALFKTYREVMRGHHAARPGYHLATAALDLGERSARQEFVKVQAEFPQIDKRQTGRRHRHVIHTTGTITTHPGFTAIGRTDMESGSTDTYTYGEEHMVEEHVFVPDARSSATGAGWLLGTALDLKRGKTLLTCLNALRLADGPVAQAELPYALPLGFHGSFLPAG